MVSRGDDKCREFIIIVTGLRSGSASFGTGSDGIGRIGLRPSPISRTTGIIGGRNESARNQGSIARLCACPGLS